jgi:hypothetical protein
VFTAAQKFMGRAISAKAAVNLPAFTKSNCSGNINVEARVLISGDYHAILELARE